MPADPQALLEACQAVVASKLVTQFVVGITTNPTRRRYAYDRWAASKGGRLDGWVVLDWGLSREQAMHTERYLFERLVDHPGYGTLETRYYPSAKREGAQSVYLAWWSPWLVYTE